MKKARKGLSGWEGAWDAVLAQTILQGGSAHLETSSALLSVL